MPRLFRFTRCGVHDGAGHLNAYVAGVVESRHSANDSSGSVVAAMGGKLTIRPSDSVSPSQVSAAP
jgi:hypothetical protein